MYCKASTITCASMISPILPWKERRDALLIETECDLNLWIIVIPRSYVQLRMTIDSLCIYTIEFGSNGLLQKLHSRPIETNLTELT